jgi:predicted ATPase
VVNVARPIASASSSRTVQLAAERVLLDEARGALVQGDPTRALDRLAQHRRTFATAILGEERDAMEVEALAKADRSAEAKAKADTFRRRMPNSLFLPAVESAVESIP